MKRLVILAGCLLSLSAYAYAEGKASEGQRRSATCATCHSANGNEPIKNYPKLAAKNYDYLINALKAYQSGDRLHSAMHAIALDLTDQDVENLAAFYAKQE